MNVARTGTLGALLLVASASIAAAGTDLSGTYHLTASPRA